MPENSATRVLFVDDSGKPSFGHPSRAVVIGGFSVQSQHVPELCRRISDAKWEFLPERGDPREWEIKSRLAPESSGRRRTRHEQFINELIRVLSQWNCTVYTVSITKSRMHHEIGAKVTMPLQMQVLAEHFAVECSSFGEMGMLVSDWSNHSLDSHVSRHLARFMNEATLPIHPCLYFADSLGSPSIQVADLIAGACRRSLEGDLHARSTSNRLAEIRSLPYEFGLRTHAGRPYETQIELFK